MVRITIDTYIIDRLMEIMMLASAIRCNCSYKIRIVRSVNAIDAAMNRLTLLTGENKNKVPIDELIWELHHADMVCHLPSIFQLKIYVEFDIEIMFRAFFILHDVPEFIKCILTINKLALTYLYSFRLYRFRKFSINAPAQCTLCVRQRLHIYALSLISTMTIMN